MSSDLSDPLVSAGLLLALAGLVLVVGLVLQARALRGDGHSRPFWQELADVGRDRGDQGLEATQAPTAQAPVTNEAPVANDRLPEGRPPRIQPLHPPVPGFDSLTPNTAAISAIDELEERLNTWIEGVEAGIAPAHEPITNDEAGIAPAQEPIANERPPEDQRPPDRLPEDQRRNDRPPEDQHPMEELAGANGSDGGRAQIATSRDVPSESTAPDVADEATSRDVAGEDGVQDMDRSWMEEFIARTKAVEESCGRADAASTRVTRLDAPPAESDDQA